jgi:hypothetical protein
VHLHSHEKHLLSFVMSICPPVHTYHCGFHWMDLFEIWHWGLLWKSVKKTKICLNRIKIMGTLHKDKSIFYCCWQHKYAMKALLCKKQYFHVVDFTCSSTIHRVHCCIAIATLVTPTCHNVTLYIYCLSCIKTVEVTVILIQIWFFLFICM